MEVREFEATRARTPDGQGWTFRDATSERAFEDDVERLMAAFGWRTFASNAEAAADYDRALALKTGSLVGFVKETQGEEWAKLEGLYGAHAESTSP